jgi:hypothetical protein
MIINTSRATAFQKCEQYAYNWDELRLMSHREADPLVIGEGYHLGSEIITKSADLTEAITTAEKRMRDRYSKQMILDEERPDIERNIEFVKRAVAAWSEHYNAADFKVLWPEVSGCVPLPNTEHHCWFAHRLLYPNLRFESCQYDRLSPIEKLPCWRRHFFKFRTDGIIEMHKKVWLLEQKTTSSTARNNFWQKFNLDFQTRGYCYGVWKATGVLVSGFLLNAIIKHSKQVTFAGEKHYQLDPTNVGFEREPYLVTERDLLDWEHDMIEIANRYEHTFANPLKIVKNTQSCFNYNRKCYYFDLCLRHQEQVDGEFRTRDDDYVNDQYFELLGIKKENLCQNQETTSVKTAG